MDLQEGSCDGRQEGHGGFRLTMRHWHYRAFLPAFEDSQPYMKAKRAGSGQSGKNLRCFIRASKANCDKALELLAGYRSFPPVGPSWRTSSVRKHCREN